MVLVQSPCYYIGPADTFSSLKSLSRTSENLPHSLLNKSLIQQDLTVILWQCLTYMGPQTYQGLQFIHSALINY